MGFFFLFYLLQAIIEIVLGQLDTIQLFDFQTGRIFFQSYKIEQSRDRIVKIRLARIRLTACSFKLPFLDVKIDKKRIFFSLP